MGLRRKKQRKGNISMTTGVVIGVVIAVLITAILAAFSALLIANEQLPISSMGYDGILIWVVSSLAGGVVAGKTVTEKKLIACLVTGGVYILLLFGVAITLFDGLGQAVWAGAVSVLIGCGCAILVAQKPKNGTRRLKKMRISR